MVDLIGKQREDFQKALAGAFPTLSALTMLVKNRLSEDLAINVNTGAPLGEVIFNLIGWAEAQGRLDELIRVSLDAKPDNAYLFAIVSRLRDRAPAPLTVQWYDPANPYNTGFINDSQTFLNRRELRTDLKDMTTPFSARVLVINGDPQTGKSYSDEVIKYLGTAIGSYKIISIDLKDEIAIDPVYGPSNLARTIVQQMGLDVASMPPQDGQPAQYARSLRDWLIGLLQKSSDTWWIVLDGFKLLDQSNATHVLIQYLTAAAAGNIDRLRVVLLDYTAQLPVDVLPRVRWEILPPVNAINCRQEMSEFFERVFKVADVGYDPDALAEAVDDAVAAYQAGGDSSLSSLAATAREKLIHVLG